MHDSTDNDNYDSTDNDNRVEEHEGGSESRAFADGDLGTIQNILFGSQAQQFEGRMAELEARIQANADALRAQVRSELDASEQSIRAHVDGRISELRVALGSEQQSRLEAIDDLQHSQRGHAKELSEAIGAVDHKLHALASEREVLAELFDKAANTLRSMDVRADET